MRAIAHACLLSLVIFGAGTGNSIASLPPGPSREADAQHRRVLVTFANELRQSPGPAGTTGRRYTGDGYLVTQSAHQQAKRVATQYSLREVASWPIKTLAVHCVVYEIPDDRSIAAVLALLAKDSHVALAEPL